MIRRISWLGWFEDEGNGKGWGPPSAPVYERGERKYKQEIVEYHVGRAWILRENMIRGSNRWQTEAACMKFE